MTDALLQEAPWVRRLAFSLAANPHDAADLEQDIWQAALSRTGGGATADGIGSVRGWLTGTARKLAAFRARTAARARAREAAAAAPEAVLDDAAMLTARQELHRSLLDAVERLPDAMRQALLLRYFEGLAPREIAARLGVPVNTVQTRLQRGRERLRAELDRVYDRRATWAAVALVDWRHGAAGTAAGVATPPIAALLLMSTSKPALAGLAALVLIVPTWLALSEGEPAAGTRAAEPAARQVSMRPEEPADEPAAPEPDAAPRSPIDTPVKSSPPPAGTGRVVDREGNPIEGAAVRFGEFADLSAARWPRAATRTTDEEGLFALPPEAASYLHPVHPGFVADRRYDTVNADGPTVLTMHRLFTVPLTVTLTDQATGEPVPRFTLTARSFWNETDPNREKGQPRLFSAPDEIDCRDGSFTGEARFVEGAERWFVALDCPGLEPPRSGVPPEELAIAIQEARSALREHVRPVPGQPIRLHFEVDLGRWERAASHGVYAGTVLDARTREPVAGVEVGVRPAGAPVDVRTVQTDARGAFRITRPDSGDDGLLAFRHPEFARQTIRAAALDGSPILLQPRADLTVIVLDENGSPMAEQACTILHVETEATSRTAPGRLLTDAEGVVRRESIEPGRYLVLVLDGVQANDDHPLATASFEVAAGADEKHTIRVGAGGATVTGLVLQPNGQPMDASRGAVSVFLLPQSKAGAMVRSERSKTPGRWLAKNVPPGEYLAMIQVGRGDQIIAWLPGIEIAPVASTTVDLQVPAGSIDGRIIGYDGDPASLRVLGLPVLPAGSTAAGMLTNPEARRALAVEVAADGSFSIPSTANGAWTLEVLAGADGGMRSARTAEVIATRTVTVRGGARVGDWVMKAQVRRQPPD